MMGRAGWKHSREGEQKVHPMRQEQAETERRPLWLELECTAGAGPRSGKSAGLDPGGHCEAQSGVWIFFLSIMGRY